MIKIHGYYYNNNFEKSMTLCLFFHETRLNVNFLFAQRDIK